jgi:uncharacterized protein YacL
MTIPPVDAEALRKAGSPRSERELKRIFETNLEHLSEPEIAFVMRFLVQGMDYDRALISAFSGIYAVVVSFLAIILALVTSAGGTINGVTISVVGTIAVILTTLMALLGLYFFRTHHRDQTRLVSLEIQRFQRDKRASASSALSPKQDQRNWISRLLR